MVYEASLIAHSVAVDHHAAIQVQTVLATVGEVLLHHTAPEVRWKRGSGRLKGERVIYFGVKGKLIKAELQTQIIQNLLKFTRISWRITDPTVSPKLVFANHLSQVLDDELSRA